MFYHVKAERVKSDVKYLQKSLKDTIVPEVSYIYMYVIILLFGTHLLTTIHIPTIACR